MKYLNELSSVYRQSICSADPHLLKNRDILAPIEVGNDVPRCSCQWFIIYDHAQDGSYPGTKCQTRLLEGLLYLTDDNGLELAELYIYNATRPILFSPRSGDLVKVPILEYL